MKNVIVIPSNIRKLLWISQIFSGFAVLELSKLHMYETYYDVLQPYFGEKNLHLHYMDTDS